MTISINVLLDVRGVDCPIPTIETKNALDQMATGEVLKVISSKEGTINNIRTLVANNSCELLKESNDEEGFIFFIKKI